MESGSQWRKWDLHIHTPCSFQHGFSLNKSVPKEEYQNAIWEKYLEYLEKIQDISVIGITDYFSIDGYKKILEYRSKGKIQNFDAVLPNIEFRLDNLVDGKKLNYHVIFSDEVPVKKIEKEFLESLTIKTKSGHDRNLTKENIKELGKEVKNHQADFADKSDYEAGCINATVSIENIIDTLKSRGPLFEGKYLLVLVDEDWNKINWSGQGHLIKSILFGRAHAVFSASEKTRQFALGKTHISIEKFVEEFGNPKACIHGSDTHSFDNFCIPSNEKYCWIKADPTFDGLKQIIYEPEERVRIQPENPELRKNIFSLKSIGIKNCEVNEELSFNEQIIPLNLNLIAITGGKGSGKTALLDFIANCYENRCKSGGEDKNSFIQRIEDQKNDLNISLEFIGDGTEKFSKNIIEDSFVSESRITYLPQGKIEEISGDRKKLDKKILEIVFNNKDVIDENFREKFELFEEKKGQIIQNIEKTFRDISILEKSTTNEFFQGLDASLKLKLGELKNKEDELSLLVNEIEQGISEKITAYKEKEKESRQILKKIQILQSAINDLQLNLETSANEINSKITRINKITEDLGIENSIIPTLEFNFQLEKISNILSVLPEKNIFFSGQITELHTELNKLSGSEKKQAELLKEIETNKNEIVEINSKLEEFDLKKKRIDELEEIRVSQYLELLRLYHDWRNIYDEVIKVFSEGKNAILSDVKFESKIHFNDKEFLDNGIEIFNKRKIHLEEIEKYVSQLPVIILEKDEKTRESSLKKYLKQVLVKNVTLKPKRSKNDMFDWIFGDYLSLSTEIKFWNTSLDKLSMGQKGTVLLKLFLAEGDYPIILDQPEENLDNRYIYNELVRAIRDAKMRRQIIIATNNANLVVNTDAEQLIVADFTDKKISYKTGSLENKTIRENIMPILEGGREAFKKREEKYGIIGI